MAAAPADESSAAADESSLAEALAVAEAAEAQLAERAQQAQQLEEQLGAVTARLEVGCGWGGDDGGAVCLSVCEGLHNMHTPIHHPHPTPT